MSGVLRVAVVRPYKTTPQLIGQIVGFIAGMFLATWALMLILDEFLDPGLSYRRTLLLYLGLRIVQTGPGWMNWTHPHPKDKA